MSTARGESTPRKIHHEGTSAGGFDRGWEGCRQTEFNVQKPMRGISVDRRVPLQARGKDVDRNREMGAGG